MQGNKQSLESGQIVDFANGESALVVAGAWRGQTALIYGMGSDEQFNLEVEYNEDLANKMDNEYNIVRVFGQSGLGLGLGHNLNSSGHVGRPVLWERPKPVDAGDYVNIEGYIVNRAEFLDSIESLLSDQDESDNVFIGEPGEGELSLKIFHK